MPGFGVDNPDGFSAFIGFLEDDGLFKDRHWWPQSKLLIAPFERYDFIGHLETIQTDMTELLLRAGVKSGNVDSLVAPQKHSTHSTGSSEVESYFYDKFLRSKVACLYERDFLIFNYDL